MTDGARDQPASVEPPGRSWPLESTVDGFFASYSYATHDLPLKGASNVAPSGSIGPQTASSRPSSRGRPCSALFSGPASPEPKITAFSCETTMPKPSAPKRERITAGAVSIFPWRT
ncbi:MAG: hypothetical protein IPN83_22515 [Holophagales bacterium]|nr:hypothetical protein [Holophagales bacterium]